ncbi:MAG: hypothetical protein ACK5JM_01045 [Rhodoblastus sp.]
MRFSFASIALASLWLALAAPAGAETIAPYSPSPQAQPPERGARTLNIPGLPPIELPPGARAFGPGGPGVDDQPAPPLRPRAGAPRPGGEESRDAGRKRTERKKPERAAPHSTPTHEEQRARVLDALYARLKTADDAGDARDVANAIDRVWRRSGSDTADLLMARAMAAIAGKDLKTAEALLDSVVVLEPDWAEGWSKRALARFQADNIEGAMSDLERTLKLDPRHFVALAGLGAILHKSGLDRRALDAYRRALELYPQQPDIRKSVEKLQIDVEGREI